MTLMYFGWIIASLLLGIFIGLSLAVFVCNELVEQKDKTILEYKKKILELQNVIQELKK